MSGERSVLTDIESYDNEDDTCQFAPRQMLVKNEEHSDGGESGTQVVEHICPRDPYPAHRVTEQNERRHRREDRQIKDGKYGIERKCLHRFVSEEPDDREEQQ